MKMGNDQASAFLAALPVMALVRHLPRWKKKVVTTAPMTQEIRSEKKSASEEPLGSSGERVRNAQA